MSILRFFFTYSGKNKSCNNLSRIGRPAISAVSGADAALIVAEPSVAGIHDMQRILQTTNHFNVNSFVVINKTDLYPLGSLQIENFCKENEIELVGKIPFDTVVTEAMVQAKPITAYSTHSAASKALMELWNRVSNKLFEKVR